MDQTGTEDLALVQRLLASKGHIVSRSTKETSSLSALVITLVLIYTLILIIVIIVKCWLSHHRLVFVTTLSTLCFCQQSLAHYFLICPARGVGTETMCCDNCNNMPDRWIFMNSFEPMRARNFLNINITVQLSYNIIWLMIGVLPTITTSK